jgi:methanogenic corrinoid protein MtbC1
MAEEQAILSRLRDCVVNLDILGVQQACRDAIAQKIPVYQAIEQGLSKGLELVGQKYEAREYFLADLMLAGEAMREGMVLLRPYVGKNDLHKVGKVLIGTVRGDLHDIGKNVVGMLLEAGGFEIMDLGTDVSPEKFVDAARTTRPDILGMSALLTTTMDEMQATIKAIERTEFRNKLKVIIGGAPASREYARMIGADAFGKDAVEGTSICKAWMNR